MIKKVLKTVILYLIFIAYILVLKNNLVEDKKNEVVYAAQKSMNNSIYSWFSREYYKVSVGDVGYGYLNTEAECNNILKEIGEIYVKENNFKNDKIISVEVVGNIKIEKEKIKGITVKSMMDIAWDIYQSDDFLNNFQVNVLYKQMKEVEIEPIIHIVRDDNMMLGESITVDGEAGLKEVEVEETYINGEKVNEKTINENITKESRDEFIYRGTKNPIEENRQFLSQPTRGGYITSNFGPRWGSTHSGMDIAGNMGDPVYSAFDGEVIQCGEYGTYGNKIMIKHEDGIETIYAHLSEFNVCIGDEVKKGDIIGLVGNTGRSTGPHLHFEVRLNGNPVDPQKYLIK